VPIYAHSLHLSIPKPAKTREFFTGGNTAIFLFGFAAENRHLSHELGA